MLVTVDETGFISLSSLLQSADERDRRGCGRVELVDSDLTVSLSSRMVYNSAAVRLASSSSWCLDVSSMDRLLIEEREDVR